MFSLDESSFLRVEGQRHGIEQILEISFLPTLVLAEIEPEFRVLCGNDVGDIGLSGPTASEKGLSDRGAWDSDDADPAGSGDPLDEPAHPMDEGQRWVPIGPSRLDYQEPGTVKSEKLLKIPAQVAQTGSDAEVLGSAEDSGIDEAPRGPKDGGAHGS